MKAKTHYTPDIEEIRVGLEIEFREEKLNFGAVEKKMEGEKWQERKWIPHTLTAKDIPATIAMYNPPYMSIPIRVKHIDREDLEKEGWTWVREGDFGLGNVFTKYIPEPPTMSDGYNSTFTMLIREDKLRITIKQQGGFAGVELKEKLFCVATIKNISEFRLFSKQLSGLTHGFASSF